MFDTSPSWRSIHPIHLLDWLLETETDKQIFFEVYWVHSVHKLLIRSSEWTRHNQQRRDLLWYQSIESPIWKCNSHWRLRLIPGIFSQIYWTCSQTAGDGWNQKSADWVEMYIRYKPQQVPASQRERTQRSFSLRDVCVCLFVCQYVYVFVYDWVEMYNKRQKIPARQDRPRERTQRIFFRVWSSLIVCCICLFICLCHDWFICCQMFSNRNEEVFFVAQYSLFVFQRPIWLEWMSFLWIATGSFMSPRKFEPVLTGEKSLGRAWNNQTKLKKTKSTWIFLRNGFILVRKLWDDDEVGYLRINDDDDVNIPWDNEDTNSILNTYKSYCLHDAFTLYFFRKTTW